MYAAVRVSRDHRAAIVASPNYFNGRPPVKTPADLLKHSCINFRHGTTELYRWEFQKAKKEVSVAVNGPLIVDDLGLAIRGALDEIGLAFTDELEVEEYLRDGRLVRVL